MNSEDELISVAMATYEGGRFINDQLSSIASQTVLPHEIVIFDDGSTDDTVDIVRGFASSAPFEVRFVANERRLGITKNFESAIYACKGDIVFLCDQDDVWYPEKVEKTLACFRRSEAVGVVCSDADVVDEALRPIGLRLWKSLGFSRAKQEQFRHGRAAKRLLRGPVLTGATMAFRAEYKDLILPIPEIWGHDGWIGLLIMSVAEAEVVDCPLIAYRQHAGNQVGYNLKAKKRKEKLKKLGKTFTEIYADRVRRAIVWRERLLEAGGRWGVPDWVVAELADKIGYLKARMGMPQSKLRRVPVVFGELLRFRYHRYAGGLKSCISDLLR